MPSDTVILFDPTSSAIPRNLEVDALRRILARHVPGETVCRTCGDQLGQETGLCWYARVAVKRLAGLGVEVDQLG